MREAPPIMPRVVTVLGWLLALGAALLVLLGVLSWPPGGPLFALPYFFFFLAARTGLPAALLIWLGRRLSGRRRAMPPPSGPAAPQG